MFLAKAAPPFPHPGRYSLAALECSSDFYVSEASGSGAVAGAHCLHGLAFAAVGRAPERPVVARADGVHGIPEFGGDAGVRRVLQHAAEFAVLDFPGDLAAELEV